MAITFVQGKTAAVDTNGALTVTLTLGAATTAGNFLVAFASSGFPNHHICTSVAAAHDTLGKLDETSAQTNDKANSWRKANIVGGDTVFTYTFDGTGDYERVWLAEFSGVDTSATPEDGTAHQAGIITVDGGTWATGTDGVKTASITPVTNGDLLIAVVWQGNTQNDIAAGTGWTSNANLRNSNPAGDDGRMEYQVQSVAAAIQGQFTDGVPSGAAGGHSMIAAFKAAATAQAAFATPVYPRIGGRRNVGPMVLRAPRQYLPLGDTKPPSDTNFILPTYRSKNTGPPVLRLRQQQPYIPAPDQGITNNMTATVGIVFGGAAGLTATGDMAATAPITFGGSAALSAVGSLAATAAITFGGAAALTATGSLAAVAAITFGGAASLDFSNSWFLPPTYAQKLFGVGPPVLRTTPRPALPPFVPAVSNDMAATVGIVFGGAAALTATGALAAVTPITFAGSAALTATGALAATPAIVFGGSAALTATGALAAALPITFSGSAALTATGALAAVAPITFGGNAALTAIGTLAAVTSITFDGLASLTALTANDMVATTLIAFSGSAALTATGTLAATSAILFALNATLTDANGGVSAGPGGGGGIGGIGPRRRQPAPRSDEQDEDEVIALTLAFILSLDDEGN